MIVDPDLPTHPKTLKAAMLLRVDPAHVVLLLIYAWGHCQHRQDDFLGRDDADIAACCRWQGNAAKLRKALQECRWIVRDEQRGGWIAHGWRVRNHSWLSRIEGGKKRQAAAKRDAAGRMLAIQQDASSPADTQLAGVIAGAEERRGEEKSTSTSPARARAYEDSQNSNADTSEPLILTKKRMCRLLELPAERPWSYAAEHALLRIVPIPEAEWLAVEWLHQQDGDPKRPKLRMSAGTLCENWQDEVSKAQQYAKTLDVPLPNETRSDSPEKKEAPAEWADFLRARGFPEASWDEAEAWLRREFRAWLSSRASTEPTNP